METQKLSNSLLEEKCSESDEELQERELLRLKK